MSWLQKQTNKQKNMLFWSVVLFYATMNHFSLDCDMQQKVEFIWQLAMTSSVVEPRRNSKAKLASKKGHGHCLVICCPSDPLQLSESHDIITEKYDQQINEMHQKLQCLQQAMINRKDPILLHNNTLSHITQLMLQKLN